MNEEYTLKQIIFSLRKEYLEAQAQLDRLRNYICIASNNITSYDFKFNSLEKEIF